MKYKFVSFVGFDKAVLSKNEQYFVASFADVPGSGTEVLVFPADRNGAITDWGEVDGGRSYASLSEFVFDKCTATGN